MPKSKFWSFRNGERFSEPISPAVELHIISTLRPGKEWRLRDLFFGIPLLQIDLTLPPASPPISPGLQRHLLSPSRGRAFDRGVLNRPLDTFAGDACEVGEE